jgi:RimJ/RimL family protein N-acetyltransferase
MEFQLANDVVRLRGLTLVDAPAIYRASEDPEISRFTRFREPRNIDDTKAWIERQPALRSQGISLVLGILPVGGMVIVGCIGLSRPSVDWRRARVGLWVGPRSRGRGFATAALELVSAWALAPPIELSRLELHIDSDNEVARDTALRAGFTFEGVLRSRRFAKGRRRDIAMYSVIAATNDEQTGSRVDVHPGKTGTVTSELSDGPASGP